MIMHVTVKLKMGASFGQYKKSMSLCKAIFERHGWKLLASYATVVGRVNSTVNIWDVPSMEAIEAGLYDPALRDVTPIVRDVVEDEVVSLMTPYSLDR